MVWDKTEKQNNNQNQNSTHWGQSSKKENFNEITSSSSDGSSFSSRPLKEGWNNEISLGGGGGNYGRIEPPECYLMEFYLNGKLKDQLTLELVEGSGIYER